MIPANRVSFEWHIHDLPNARPVAIARIGRVRNTVTLIHRQRSGCSSAVILQDRNTLTSTVTFPRSRNVDVTWQRPTAGGAWRPSKCSRRIAHRAGRRNCLPRLSLTTFAGRDHLIGHCAENHGRGTDWLFARRDIIRGNEAWGNNGSCDIFSVSYTNSNGDATSQPFRGSRP